MPYPLARPDPLDRRYNRRVPSRARGVVQLAASTVDCIIRDRSPGGLRIVFRTPVELEPEFTLVEGAGAPRRVKLIWTDGRQAGVAFSAAAEQAAA